jgi:hypothetical protein
MCDIVDLMFGDEGGVYDPWGGGEDVVDVAAVEEGLDTNRGGGSEAKRTEQDGVSQGNKTGALDTHRSACVIAVRALWACTSSSEQTPTMR